MGSIPSPSPCCSLRNKESLHLPWKKRKWGHLKIRKLNCVILQISREIDQEWESRKDVLYRIALTPEKSSPKLPPIRIFFSSSHSPWLWAQIRFYALEMSKESYLPSTSLSLRKLGHYYSRARHPLISRQCGRRLCVSSVWILPIYVSLHQRRLMFWCTGHMKS